MERLKPLNDFIFKKTFGEEETKDNLIALLNAILSKKDRDKLVTLEIVDNKELTPELIEDIIAYLNDDSIIPLGDVISVLNPINNDFEIIANVTAKAPVRRGRYVEKVAFVLFLEEPSVSL